jgi:hypothetical protein
MWFKLILKNKFKIQSNTTGFTKWTLKQPNVSWSSGNWRRFDPPQLHLGGDVNHLMPELALNSELLGSLSPRNQRVKKKMDIQTRLNVFWFLLDKFRFGHLYSLLQILNYISISLIASSLTKKNSSYFHL